MYQSIFVPVDNSEYSNRAIDQAVSLGKQFESTITGCHVYAARMHDYRFKQMEFTLPGEYLVEDEIERQRKIHDSLITMGLELISDSYLDQLGKECDAANLKLERKMMDGKHHIELVKDINETKYDLTILGALGVGKTRDSQIGTVCENVARHAEHDVMIVKHVPKDGEKERDTILVGVDGSPQSFGGVLTAMELAKKFNKKVELIGVYDPYLHYAVFNSIVDVLSEKAAKVFRFEEQNQLHEEIIDCGLAQIYQSHLNVAEVVSKYEYEGVEVSKTLLDGKAFHKILNRAREIEPWLLVLGRIGVHSDKDEKRLGSNTENLVRLAPCDILLSTRLEYPELDTRANESILWTSEAEDRMGNVPDVVRGIARTGILRLALEQGHSVITNSVIDEAMDRFMPKYTASATEKLAGVLAMEKAREGGVAMCNKCGVTASVSRPKICVVCKGTEFSVLTPEVVEKILEAEGGAEEEITYDGKKLRWSKDAREQLLAIEDKYQKRRAKARIEKVARMKRLDVITLEFASAVIMDEVGKVLFDVKEKQDHPNLGLEVYDADSDKTVVGVDEKGQELKSVFQWNDDAVARFFRVPPGFMRTRTQRRVEDFALERNIEVINVDLVVEGIDNGKDAMVEVLLDSGSLSEEQTSLLAKIKEEKTAKVVEKNSDGEAKGECPFSALFAQEKEEVAKAEKNGTNSNVYKGVVSQVLNEVGIMSQMAKEREKSK